MTGYSNYIVLYVNVLYKMNKVRLKNGRHDKIS